MRHIFGDSHIFMLFNYLAIKHQYQGCTAMGLLNKNSLSGWNKILLKEYQTLGSDDIVFFKFGQVDCEFTYFYKCLKENKLLDFRSFAEDSIDKYFEFIIKNINIKNLTVCSILPPVTLDNHIKECILTIRDHLSDEVFNEYKTKIKPFNIPSIEERTRNNKIYNEILKQKCIEHNINYLDLFTDLIGDNEITPYTTNSVNHHMENGDGWFIVNEKFKNYLKL